MKKNQGILLMIDGIINLILGILLMLAPFGAARYLGVPEPVTHLYPCVFGAVLFGIGISLLLEAKGERRGVRGLGLGGAIVINFCGAGALMAWLLLSPQVLPLRGQVILWSIVGVVVLVGVVELLTGSWRQ